MNQDLINDLTKEEELKIQRFASQMSIELEHNRHKGSILWWEDFQPMMSDFEYHKAKMIMAIRQNDKKAVKEYIADCANILLAIGNLGGLYDEPTVDDGECSETEDVMFKRVPVDTAKTNIKSVEGSYSVR